MAILVDERSRIIIQGITGNTGVTFAQRMVKHGTPLVGGVTPGKGGQTVVGAPVFDTVWEAVRRTGATASLITVPPPFVKDAFLEAATAGIGLASIYTEGVPVRETALMIAFARQYGVRLIGPNAAGVISPGRANLSDLNDIHLRPGRIGIVSKSGTLTYETIDGLVKAGMGISTVACLGGDPMIGTRHADVLRLFAADGETDVVVLIGEIGGTAEIEAARTWEELGAPKPLVAYIAGHAAPPGKRMGHAGAIVGGRAGDSAAAKSRVLAESGALVAGQVSEVPGLVAGALGK